MIKITVELVEFDMIIANLKGTDARAMISVITELARSDRLSLMHGLNSWRQPACEVAFQMMR